MNESTDNQKINDALDQISDLSLADKNVWQQQSLQQVRTLLDSLSIAEVVLLLESSPPQERKLLWQLIDPEIESDVFTGLNEDVQEQLLLKMDSTEVATLTEDMDVDDVADILQQLPEQETNEVLGLMSLHDRQRVSTVLTFEENTAGGMMDTDTITVRSDLSIDTVLRYLRRHDKLPKTTDSLFVVDRDNHYLGRVLINSLLTAEPDIAVNFLLDENDRAVHVDMPSAEVGKLFERNDWVSVAVIDDDKKLIGRMADHSLMGLAGLREEEDTFAPVRRAVSSRALWLGINLLTALFAASIIGQFQQMIEKVVALAVLMPIVASMGGIAGTQTLTVVIRGIAQGHIQSNNLRWLLRREVILSFINSLIWAFISGCIAGWWFDDWSIAWIITIAMSINLLTGAVLGTLLPVFLKRLNLDPAVSSGVILTTFTDGVGFLTFLGLAQLFYG